MLGEQPVVVVAIVQADGEFQVGLPVWAFSSITMPALPPSMTTGCPRAVVSTGEFCRSQSYRSCGVSWQYHSSLP